jgi:trans-aconitate methyltransferase
MAEFDSFSDDYEEILNRSLKISGYGGGFFAEYKARYAYNLFSENFYGKILDYGCGVGLLSSFLRKYFPASLLHGYDTSSASIQKIDRSLIDNGVFTSQKEHLDHDYELIVVSNVLHHIPAKDRQDTFKDLRNRLSIDGRLLVFEHNRLNPITRWVVSHCPLDKGVVLLPLKEAKTHMTRANLLPVRHDYMFFFPNFLRCLNRLGHFFSWCPMGAQYAVVGERKNYSSK